MSLPVTHERRANTNLVSVAWLRLAVPAETGVATTLPAPDANLRAYGFVRVATVGGSPDMYVPLRNPVVAAECWVPPATEGGRPPWGRANALAEDIIAATYDTSLMDVTLDLGAYPAARVRTVTALSEPRRIEDDPGNWARYDVDLELLWTA